VTLSGIAFFATIFAISALIGTVLGIICRGRVVPTVLAVMFSSVLFFVLLEWKFGSADEWSWQYPIQSAAYLIGPFGFLVVAPMLLSAMYIGPWIGRRSANQSQP
jgi:hypothetical protein